MKTLTKTLVAAALGCAVAVPAHAGDEPIVVESVAAMKAWSKEASADLNRNLMRKTPASPKTFRSSIVQVRFSLDEKGRATDLVTLRGSGQNRTDAHARRAVRMMRSLKDVPIASANAQDARFQANIIFARDDVERDQLVAKLDKMEATRLALGGGEDAVIVFGG